MNPNQDQQPQYRQPAQQPAFPQTQPVAQPYTAPQENPGQTLGILSIVMIFVFPILGIVFGAISRKKSKAANMPAGLGTAGLIINIIVTILGILTTILFVILVIIGANASDSTDSSLTSLNDSGSSSLGSSNQLEDNAKLVEKLAEAYNAEAGDYPKNTNDFSKYSASTIPSDVKVYSSLLLTNTSLTYIYCGAGSAQIVYLGDSKEDKRITPLGLASSTEVCAKQF